MERLGLPLSLNADTVIAALAALTPDQQAEAAALGLAEFSEGYSYPLWSIVLRYHWTQTFPAGKVIQISHAYENRSSGGIFGWSHPPEEYQQYTVDQYCIDEATSKGLVKALKQNPTDGEAYSMGMSLNIAYVLRTANSWAGPIGRFKLTIDKGDTGNILSLCADGIKKTGPTTFVMEKTNFTPMQDLQILIAMPMQN
jgi:Domain of unknown function (DUF4424)